MVDKIDRHLQIERTHRLVDGDGQSVRLRQARALEQVDDGLPPPVRGAHAGPY
jgi:hypothetical protein